MSNPNVAKGKLHLVQDALRRGVVNKGEGKLYYRGLDQSVDMYAQRILGRKEGSEYYTLNASLGRFTLVRKRSP